MEKSEIDWSGKELELELELGPDARIWSGSGAQIFESSMESSDVELEPKRFLTGYVCM